MDNVNAKTQERINRIHQVFVVEMHDRCRDGSSCCYVKDGHPGCAIGCTLTDEQRAWIIASGDNTAFVDDLPGEWFNGEDVEFFKQLQGWHDIIMSGATQAERHESLKELVEPYGYTVPEFPRGTK